MRSAFFKHLFAGEYSNLRSSLNNKFATDRTKDIGSFLAKVKSVCENNECPEMVKNGLKNIGVYGMSIPKEYGGLGFNHRQEAEVSNVLGEYDLGICIHVGSHQSLASKAITLHASEAIKTKYLQKLSTAEHFSCFCMTEPLAGSNITNIITTATTDSFGNNYVINGKKCWISNGNEADCFVVFVKIDGSSKNSCILVQRDHSISSSITHPQMGLKNCQAATISFNDTIIPKTNLIGILDHGSTVATSAFTSGRFQLAATLCGTMRRLIKLSIERSIKREQFGRKLVDWPDIKRKIADMKCFYFITTAMVELTSAMLDAKESAILEASASKIFATECAWDVCDEMLQIYGGIGCCENIGFGQLLLDLRILRILEGTNDILRFFIISKAFKSIAGKSTPFLSFSPISNFLKCKFHKNEFFHPTTNFFYEEFQEMCRSFHITLISKLMIYGSNITNHQVLGRHLSDMSISLFGIYSIICKFDSEMITDSSESLFHLSFRMLKNRYNISKNMLDDGKWMNDVNTIVDDIASNLL